MITNVLNNNTADDSNHTNSSSEIKTNDRPTDAHGNDLELTQKFDKMASETEHLACLIHKKSYKDHNDEELLEDYSLSGLRYQKSQGHLYHTDEIEPNEYNSLEDLAKAGISNYDLQAAVASSTRRDWNSFLELNGYIASILLNALDQITSKPSTTKFHWISILIVSRIQRLTANATNLACDGYYDASMTLLRTIMENYLLLEYLKEHQDIVDDFYDMKVKISSTKLVNEMRNKHEEFGPIWGELCEHYVHATALSIHSITTPTDNPEITQVHFLPYYKKKSAYTALSFTVTFKLLALTLAASIFSKKIKNVDKLFADILGFQRVFGELQKNPHLQIEFDNEDRRNL